MLTLSRLKQYMIDNREATMQGLIITFREEPDTILHLMEHLIAKGVVEEANHCFSGCGTQCGSCTLSTEKVYRIVEQG